MSPRRPFQLYRENTDIFVESGSYLGGGIQEALDTGFKHVISYEVAQGLHDKCRQRFAHDARVELFHRPSQSMLPDILKYPDSRIFFWLDGHFSFLDTSYVDTTCPILLELAEIAQHPRKDHVILIDDVRLFGTREFAGVTIEEVKEAILKINPAYRFEFTNGHVQDDIMVARIT